MVSQFSQRDESFVFALLQPWELEDREKHAVVDPMNHQIDPVQRSEQAVAWSHHSRQQNAESSVLGRALKVFEDPMPLCQSLFLFCASHKHPMNVIANVPTDPVANSCKSHR
jgi:hypothetical protein